MDPQVYARQRFAETAPALPWQPLSPASSVSWQNRLRTALGTCLGIPTGEQRPVATQIVATKQFSRYRRETIRMESRRGLELFAYFLTPNEAVSAPRPAVLCLPGHGRGVDSIVGLAADGSQREMEHPDEYQADFALQCVARGYPTFALEQISFGHRRDAQARAEGDTASSCVRDSMAALMLGESMTGWRVWDAMRALDYMQTRPEVDPQKLITMGISGGGLTSFFTACLDTRVQACVVSGYFNTFRDSILAINHCVDNYVPGLLNLAEMPDLTGLIAPRALFVESGVEDPIFPLAAFEKAADRAQEIYSVAGVPGNFGREVFAGDHHFHGVGAFQFLAQHFPSR